MRGILGGLMLAAVGCRGAEQAYTVDVVYQDDCGTGLGRGAELVLTLTEDDAGAEQVSLDIPELGLSIPCADYDGFPEQVCARETEDGATERWFWGREGDALGAAMDRTGADGSFCMSTMTARPWGHVEVTEDDLEQAAWVAAFLAAPPEVQLGAAAALGWLLLQFSDGDLSSMADASS